MHWMLLVQEMNDRLMVFLRDDETGTGASGS